MAGPPLEGYIELVGYGVESTASAQVCFNRTQHCINTADYAGDSVVWTVEFNCSNSDSSVRAVELVYSTTINNQTSVTSVASWNVPTGGTVTRYSTTFTPYNGTAYYYIRIAGTTSNNQCIVWTGTRVRVVVTGATKFAVWIPMVDASASASMYDSPANLDAVLTTTYSQATPAYWGAWKYTAAEWADIVDVQVHHLFSAKNSGYAVQQAIVTSGSTTVLTGSDVPANDKNTTAHIVIQTVAAGDLTDGRLYAGAALAADTNASHCCQVQDIDICVRLSNAAGLTKIPIWLRASHEVAATTGIYFYRSRAVLNSDNYGGTGSTVAYYTESFGKNSSGTENDLRIADGSTSDTGTSGTDITAATDSVIQFASTTNVWRRSVAWTPPTSGNRVFGHHGTTTGTVTAAQTFIVITTAYTATPPTGIGTQINIGDAWKPATAAQINIGDAWKPVTGIQVNIGDAWKRVL